MRHPAFLVRCHVREGAGATLRLCAAHRHDMPGQQVRQRRAIHPREPGPAFRRRLRGGTRTRYDELMI